MLTVQEQSRIDVKETCYRIGFDSAIAHKGRHAESIIVARSLMFKYPDRYLTGYYFAMEQYNLYFPEDMTRPTITGDVLVDMLAE